MSDATKRPGADLDAWVRQIQVLEDLKILVRRHGPNSASPLPVLPWQLGAFHTAGAEIFAHTDTDPVGTLDAFAAVLDSELTCRHLEDRLIYIVKGRIGPKQGTKQEPRTQVVIRATVFHPLEDEETGR